MHSEKWVVAVWQARVRAMILEETGQVFAERVAATVRHTNQADQSEEYMPPPSQVTSDAAYYDMK